MMDLPRSTAFGRRIPKTKFYENTSVTPQLRRVFTEQIQQIVWQNKIAPSTTNVGPGHYVEEIEVFVIKLNQRRFDTKVLAQVDREIPYHILFLLEYNDERQAWIGYKEARRVKTGACKPPVYYHTGWTPKEHMPLKLDGLNMDSLYENLIRQVAGDRLSSDTSDITQAIERDVQRQKLQREIARLERKIKSEKQFNRQVELNGELKRLREGI